MICTDHKGMFWHQWWTELMRKDMFEHAIGEDPHIHTESIVRDIDRRWPRAYVLTPPVIPFKIVTGQTGMVTKQVVH